MQPPKEEALQYAKQVREARPEQGDCPACGRDTLITRFPPMYPEGLCTPCLLSIIEATAAGTFSKGGEQHIKAIMLTVLQWHREHLENFNMDFHAVVDDLYPKCRELRKRYIALGFLEDAGD